MRDRQHSEEERENALWRITIYRYFQREDLESLIELKESPECFDEEIIELLDKCIKELESKRKEKGQER